MYQSKVKKVHDGYEYLISDPCYPEADCKGFSTEKPDLKKLTEKINGRVEGNAKSFFDRNIKSGTLAEAEKQIINLMDKTPRTIPQVVKLLNLTEWVTRKVINRLADKGTLKTHKTKGKKGAVAYTL